MNVRTTLVTGIAGFIGFHTARRLLERGEQVVGVDSINDYYDVRLKYARLRELGLTGGAADGAEERSVLHTGLRFVRADLADGAAVRALFERERFERVCHLAAQAGVRYSLSNPDAYVSANVQGFLNVLEACRAVGVQHLVYASSSSVYGIETRVPFTESAAADHPASLYAATKRSNELMAHTYAHLFGLPSTGLRFFTVYGPWGRPDMAPILFASAIAEGRPMNVFNHGEMQRDFTYIDDIVEGVVRVLDRAPVANGAWDGVQSAVSSAPYRVYNIGNGAPVHLMEFIRTIERHVGRRAEMRMLPMQPGDVPITWADCSTLERDTGYRPSTDIDTGIERFVRWYRDYYGAGG